MTSVQLIIYVILLAAEVLGVASLMEVYKKSIRKNKATTWEIRGVGLVASALAIGVLILAQVFQPFLGLIGAKLWMDYLFYVLVFYFLQMQADMKVVKKIVKSLVKAYLISKRLPKEQVDEILGAIKTE